MDARSFFTAVSRLTPSRFRQNRRHPVFKTQDKVEHRSPACCRDMCRVFRHDFTRQSFHSKCKTHRSKQSISVQSQGVFLNRSWLCLGPASKNEHVSRVILTPKTHASALANNISDSTLMTETAMLRSFVFSPPLSSPGHFISFSRRSEPDPSRQDGKTRPLQPQP